ncbi:hypothetical protein INT43_008240 [Umbelopsis isabellina]|uniref:Cyclin N-terminal domain-containing protein n=1 Tax=Mortierella isabellina TaxID=91625 RepID=A0A8H7PD72_MORIS|nr:hypothetical protein INT43_008240 [Umbelopsis isabellina]
MAIFPDDVDSPSVVALHHLVRSPISSEMLALVTQKAASVIDCQPTNYINSKPLRERLAPKSMKSVSQPIQSQLPSPPATPSVGEANVAATPNYQAAPTAVTTPPYQTEIPPLDEFIRHVVKRSNVQTGTLLASLVYTARLQRKLVAVAKGLACTCHRIFLATLIVTAKYLNDTSPKNKHWARYAVIFSVPEINLMEKQLLFLLEYNLRISQTELLQALSNLLPAPKPTQLQDDDMYSIPEYIHRYMVDHSPPLSEYDMSHRHDHKRQVLHDSAYSSDNCSPVSPNTSSIKTALPVTLSLPIAGDHLEHQR